MIWKILVFFLAGYVALGSIVFFIQRKMLYFPNVSPLSEERASEAGLRHWPSHKNFRGFTGIGETADARGTIIVFHGNAGAAWDRSFYVKALSRQNFRVVLAEYPGYGGRSGHPGEDVMVEDALETIRLAHQEHGGPVFLWGESLGCGVVAHAVRLSDIPIKGVVLFLPWDSLPDLAQAHYWFLPARWLVLDKFNNVENLEKYEGKIAVILAENDEVIPVRHGQRLFESILTGKKLWLFEGASHNEMPIAADQPWWGEVTGFVSR